MTHLVHVLDSSLIHCYVVMCCSNLPIHITLNSNVIYLRDIVQCHIS